MKKIYLLVLTLSVGLLSYSQNQNFIIDNSFPYLVNEQTLGSATIGGDTIFISSSRTNPLKFQFINGDTNNPLVVINKGGQVKIDSSNKYSWGAITFENCKYIKISGAGHPNYKYGFELSADQCGLAFVELSSDCEAEFIKIAGKTNEKTTNWVYQNLLKIIKKNKIKLSRVKILILGLSYKKNIEDTRESAGIKILLLLIKIDDL